MRLLSELKSDGVLDLEGRRITVRSQDKLSALANL